MFVRSWTDDERERFAESRQHIAAEQEDSKIAEKARERQVEMEVEEQKGAELKSDFLKSSNTKRTRCRRV